MLTLSRQKTKIAMAVADITQRQLADIVGCDEGLLSRRLHGKTKTSLDYLGALADALNCQPVDILDYTPSRG